MRSGSATEVPPNFCTRRATAVKATGGPGDPRTGFGALYIQRPCRPQTNASARRRTPGWRARQREAELQDANAPAIARSATRPSWSRSSSSCSWSIITSSSGGKKKTATTNAAAVGTARRRPRPRPDADGGQGRPRQDLHRDGQDQPRRRSCSTLDAKDAPIGASSFVFLARHGFYNGLALAPRRQGLRDPGRRTRAATDRRAGYAVVGEVPKDHYPVGSLAAAKTGSDPPGTVRLAVLHRHRRGPGRRACRTTTRASATVTAGIDVVQKIEALPVDANSDARRPRRPSTR